MALHWWNCLGMLPVILLFGMLILIGSVRSRSQPRRLTLDDLKFERLYGESVLMFVVCMMTSLLVVLLDPVMYGMIVPAVLLALVMAYPYSVRGAVHDYRRARVALTLAMMAIGAFGYVVMLSALVILLEGLRQPYHGYIIVGVMMSGILAALSYLPLSTAWLYPLMRFERTKPAPRISPLRVQEINLSGMVLGDDGEFVTKG